MRTTVIYHSADHDGIFCREIAKKFLPDAELVGWDFTDPPIPLADITGSLIYVLDLPLDKPFGLGKSAFDGSSRDIVWIDHHKSSIDSHPTDIPGYRIDGVAACRLAWQWFTHDVARNVMCDAAYLPTKEEYFNRTVKEPLAIRLAGEYDVWDHRGDGDLEFQFGLDATEIDLQLLLDETGDTTVRQLVLPGGVSAMRCYAKRDADIMRSRSFLVDWEGLRFLCLNTARCNSNTFADRDVPETGHDALMGFWYDGKIFNISLYHAKHRTDLDLSKIAVKHGGGGHRGACGFRTDKLPFQ